MLRKQTSNASDSEESYSFGLGRCRNNSSAASTSAATTSQLSNPVIDGSMILKPGNPEYSDIFLEEIARISKQQRYESASGSNVPSTSSSGYNPFSLNDGPSTSSQGNSNLTNEQQLNLMKIASQYATNSLYPLNLSDQESVTQRKQSISDALVRANFTRAEQQPVQFNNHDLSFPMMLQRDNQTSCLTEFFIGSHKIIGFVVGGEPRLCLPQFKAMVLPDCNMVDNLMTELQIATVNTTSSQLNQLIQANALPKTISYCPLITRSNAERLINYCIIKGVRPIYGIGNTDNFIDAGVKSALQNEALQVYHFCFGGQTGTFYPSLLGGSCIECTSCHRLFKPPEFVRHTHVVMSEVETKVCDWGFDTANWNYYIALSEETEITREAEQRLSQLITYNYDPRDPSSSIFNQDVPQIQQPINLNPEIVGQS